MNGRKKLIDEEGWVFCPFCYAKTRTKIRPDTMAKRWPLFCRKCNHESTVDIENMQMKLSSEPDATTLSR